MRRQLTAHIDTTRTPLVSKIAEILEREFFDRGEIVLSEVSDAADLTLTIRPGIGLEGFSITATGAGIRITRLDDAKQ